LAKQQTKRHQNIAAAPTYRLFFGGRLFLSHCFQSPGSGNSILMPLDPDPHQRSGSDPDPRHLFQNLLFSSVASQMTNQTYFLNFFA